MKKQNLMAVCAIILTMALLCGGCAAGLQSMENTEVRQSTEAMLDALIADDFQTAYSLVSRLCTEEEFKPIFAQMQELFRSADTYELSLLSIHTNSTISGGQKSSSVSSVYELTTKSEKLIVSVRIDDQTGMNSFYLTPYEYTDYYYTGTLENMKGTTGLQWGVLLLNVVVLGLVVFALVDCCRQKIRNKVLWILLLVLGFVTVGTTVSATGFRLNFHVGWITAYSALIRYGTGAVTVRLMLPVGAIIYFAKRRSLLWQSAPMAAPVETGYQIPAEAIGMEQQPVQPPMDPPALDAE